MPVTELFGTPDGIDDAVQRIVIEAAANVRPPDEGGIADMLDRAFHGHRPATG